ncbi:MAG TPA: hypothetical protein VGN17_30700 [Bryobacteraceae bacterium]|jgi:hypothetical protein
MNNNDFAIETDPRSIIGAIDQMNSAFGDLEKRGTSAADGLRSAWNRNADLLLKVVDKQHEANLRLVRSIEAQSAAYGRSGVDRLIAQRDQYIKRLGSEATAIDQVRAAYDRMIEVEKRRGGAEGNYREMAEMARNAIEAPANAIGGLLEKIGPAGGILAGAAAGLTALAAAGFEAAKSVGETSIRMRDVEERMGVTDREAAKLSFSAKAAGQDVGIFERAMRGLTEAATDQSTEGEKARAWLQRFGVDAQGLRDGSVRTYDALTLISKGLEDLPAGIQRTRAEMDLFKRAGVEMGPAMVAVRENAQYFDEHGLPVWTDADQKRGAEYLKWATSVEASWQNILLNIKGAIAGAAEFATRSPTRQPEHPDAAAAVKAGQTPGIWAPQDQRAQVDALRRSELAKLSARQRQFDRTEEGLKALLSHAELVEKEKREDVSNAFSNKNLDPAQIKARGDDWDKARTEAAGYKRQVEAIAEAHRELAKIPALREKGMSFLAGNVDLPEFLRQAREEEQKTLALFWEEFKGKQTNLAGLVLNSGLGRSQQIVREGRLKELDEAVKSLPREESDKDLWESMGESIRQESRRLIDAGAEVARQRDELNKARLSYQEDLIRVHGDPKLEVSRKEYDPRVAAAAELDIVGRIYDLRMSAAKDSAEQQVLALGYLKDELRIQDELARKQSELLDRQQEELQKASAGLLSTLFTRPSDFGKQLASTLREAVMKPVTEGLGGMMARTLHPLVFGADGQGGIAGAMRGLFGGGSQQAHVQALDFDTGALMRHAAAVLAMGAAMGMSGIPSFASTTLGTTVGQAVSAPAASIGGDAGYAGGLPGVSGGSGGSFSGGGGGSPWFPGVPGLAGAPGGTSGFAGPIRSGGSGGGGSFGGFKALGGTFSGTLDHIGANFQNYLHPIPGGSSLQALSTGPASGTPLAGAAMGGGVALAEHGLLGDARGTASGVLQGAAGGFLIAGPIGAAVGAAIGLGEMIAGVESPPHEAQRLVKAIYHMDIDMKMARQIVQLANSKYGQHVSIAVRSPEVREMLGLYAAGTGQKFPASASTPHGGSLIQSGGSLYQGATYQYGNAYAYSSSLPVMGAGPGGAQLLPSPGGPTMVSLVIGGQSAADLLEGRIANTVTPGYVQDQYSGAMAASNGRTSNSAAMLGVPNLIVS